MSGINIPGWKKMWEVDKTPFHKENVNSFLCQCYEKLVNNGQDEKIFVPLCGKSLDMKWLLDKGHRVVGLEVSAIAIEAFMTDNKFEYTTEKYSGGEVFKTKDGRCSIYRGDLFEFNSGVENGFDAIWDRGSLVAIGPDQRETYLKLMKTLLAPNGRFMIETYYSCNPDYKGPPFNIDSATLTPEIHGLFTSETLLEKDKTDPSVAEHVGNLFREDFPMKLCIFLLKPTPALNIECLDDWTTAWDENKIGWHRNYITPTLRACFSLLCRGRSKQKIFIPLCGRSLDMKWLLDEGHVVVGVEYVSKAVEEFFAEHKIQHTVHDIASISAKLYKSVDGRLRVYCGDFFKFSSEIESEFDAVWDRASFVAISPDQQNEYSAIILSLMSPDARYCIESYEYSNQDFSGTPRPITDIMVKEVFGSRCSIHKVYLEKDSDPTICKYCGPLKKAAKEVTVHVHLMTLKASDEQNLWKLCWENGPLVWHRNYVNPYLLKFYDCLTASQEKLKIFVPLCGKSLDIKWLLDKGHTVHGVELSHLAIEAFLKENDLSYTVEDCREIGGYVYKTMNDKCHLYCGDFFLFNCVNNMYDAIWDRASMQAIDPAKRSQYIHVMKNIMSPTGRIVLETQRYANLEFKGPPYSTARQDVQHLFDDWCSVQELHVASEEDSGVKEYCSHMFERTGAFELSFHLMQRK